MIAATVALNAGAGSAARLPRHFGQCALTRIRHVGTRLEDGVTHQPIAGTGSAVDFANGGRQVSYDAVVAVDRSQAGDPVKMCLVSIPHPCPPGDNRGRQYRTTNLRTRQAWLLPDSEHMCGGA